MGEQIYEVALKYFNFIFVRDDEYILIHIALKTLIHSNSIC
jgi:hypothetical protein